MSATGLNPRTLFNRGFRLALRSAHGRAIERRVAKVVRALILRIEKHGLVSLSRRIVSWKENYRDLKHAGSSPSLKQRPIFVAPGPWKPEQQLIPKFDVLIPTYGINPSVITALTFTLEQLSGVANIFISDDASEEKDLHRIEKLAEGFSNVTLRVEKRNIGYTKNANKLLAMASGDAILMNSDCAITTEDAIELISLLRLRSEFVALSPIIPFDSGFSAIPSARLENLPKLDEATLKAFAALNRKRHKGLIFSYPTIHGCCMAFSQEAMALTGGFNETFFPWGYGEENYFAQKLIARGRSVGIALGARGLHLGTQSFKIEEKDQLVSTAMRIMNTEFPSYADSVFEAKSDLERTISSISFTEQMALKDSLEVESASRGGTIANA